MGSIRGREFQFPPRLDGDFVCVANGHDALIWNWRDNTHGIVPTETGLNEVGFHYVSRFFCHPFSDLINISHPRTRPSSGRPITSLNFVQIPAARG